MMDEVFIFIYSPDYKTILSAFTLLVMAAGMTFLMCGCLGMQDREERTAVKVVTASKQDFKGNVDAEYPSPSNTSVTVTASGNAAIAVNVPSVEPKMSKLSSHKEGRMSADTSFSFDKYIKSVSTAGWALLVLSLCVLLYMLVYFINKTYVGKAADKVLGASITGVHSIIGELTEKVAHADVKTPEWATFNEMLNKRKTELQLLLEKKR